MQQSDVQRVQAEEPVRAEPLATVQERNGAVGVNLVHGLRVEGKAALRRTGRTGHAVMEATTGSPKKSWQVPLADKPRHQDGRRFRKVVRNRVSVCSPLKVVGQSIQRQLEQTIVGHLDGCDAEPHRTQFLRQLLSVIPPRFEVQKPHDYTPETPSSIGSSRYVPSIYQLALEEPGSVTLASLAAETAAGSRRVSIFQWLLAQEKGVAVPNRPEEHECEVILSNRRHSTGSMDLGEHQIEERRRCSDNGAEQVKDPECALFKPNSLLWEPPSVSSLQRFQKLSACRRNTEHQQQPASHGNKQRLDQASLKQRKMQVALAARGVQQQNTPPLSMGQASRPPYPASQEGQNSILKPREMHEVQGRLLKSVSRLSLGFDDDTRSGDQVRKRVPGRHFPAAVQLNREDCVMHDNEIAPQAAQPGDNSQLQQPTSSPCRTNQAVLVQIPKQYRPASAQELRKRVLKKTFKLGQSGGKAVGR